MRRRSMTGDTVPGTWRRVNRSASGKISQNTSRQRSPPRIPVSQSWTRATRIGPPGRAGSARCRPDALAPVVEELAKRLLEGDLDLPAGRAVDLAGVALQQHHVRGAQAG